ncbi:MAG: hypothetical protein U0T77_04810 [Chitinophagales bacterium]
MKNTLFLLLLLLFITGCKKNESTLLNCKVSKKLTHYSSGYTDTTIFTYSVDDYTQFTTYSNSSDTYFAKYMKNSSQYDLEYYYSGILGMTGFITLTASGLFDTSRVTNLSTATFNNRSKNYFDADGYLVRSINNFNIYENDVRYFYTDGNYAYWIYEYTNFSNPSSSSKDSIVFEYYNDKLKTTELYPMESKYGKLEKNLVKRRLYYNLLAAGTLRQTYDYEYLTDGDGLVTRQIWTIRSQPDNTVTRSDTTYFEYVCE